LWIRNDQRLVPNDWCPVAGARWLVLSGWCSVAELVEATEYQLFNPFLANEFGKAGGKFALLLDALS
jgi:hypothetical protein